jgi:hypothetical protein
MPQRAGPGQLLEKGCGKCLPSWFCGESTSHGYLIGKNIVMKAIAQFQQM